MATTVYLDACGAGCRPVWLLMRPCCASSTLLSQQRLLELLIQDKVQVMYELCPLCNSLAQPAESILPGIPAGDTLTSSCCC